MDRRKVDYMIKNLYHLDKRELYYIIDLDGTHNFNLIVKEFLLDINTKDKLLLALVPGGGDNKELYDEFIQKYVDIFKNLNELCIKNHAAPIFPHPEDLKESELQREELIKLYPEEELNKYFGVESFYDYEPPYYEG